MLRHGDDLSHGRRGGATGRGARGVRIGGGRSWATATGKAGGESGGGDTCKQASHGSNFHNPGLPGRPYACAVQVESWSEDKDALKIGAVIVVERESQKAIVVGRGGARVRELGIAARHAVGEALGRTVHLSLFVKVISEWSRAEAGLRRLGYAGEGGAS